MRALLHRVYVYGKVQMIHFELGIPQLIYLGFAVYAVVSDAINHGKPKTGKQNVWTTIVAVLIVIVLLSWGGFFSKH